MTKRIKIIVYVTICLLVLGYIIYSLIGVERGMKHLFNNTIANTHDFVYDYEQLFNDSTVQQAQNIETINSPIRSPITKFICQDKYIIIVTKIDNQFNGSLLDIVKVKRIDFTMTANLPSRTVTNVGSFKFEFIDTLQPPIKQINVYLNGDAVKSLEEDRVLNYCGYLKSASVGYNNNNRNDYFFEVRGQTGSALNPANLLFLGRNGAVYMIVAYAKDAKEALPCNILTDIIVK